MRQLNRRILIIALTVMAICFTGCNEKIAQNAPVQDGKINIITTNFPLYDFCREIGGEQVSVTMLIPPGSEAHTYEPTPQDIIAIQNCDVFFYIGGESDVWVEGILAAMEQDLSAIALMDSEITLFTEPSGDSILQWEQTEEEEYDEHIWTSPKNAQIMVKCITDTLSACDPVHGDGYRDACDNYLQKLSLLDSDFRTAVANGKWDTVIFADRFPMLYFTKEYGLNYFAAFPGCAAEAEPSAAVVSSLIEKVQEESVPAVFYIELSNRKMADMVSGESGAEPLLFHSCQNVTKDEFQDGASYLSIMRQNLQNLKTALG